MSALGSVEQAKRLCLDYSTGHILWPARRARTSQGKGGHKALDRTFQTRSLRAVQPSLPAKPGGFCANTMFASGVAAHDSSREI